MVRLFRKDSRRVPKWYSNAPNRSGRIATRLSSSQAPSRSNAAGGGSVDTAHTVDGDLFDEQILGEDLVVGGRGVLGLLGHRDSSGTVDDFRHGVPNIR